MGNGRGRGRSGEWHPQVGSSGRERSLARLGTDYIDHYQLHRPDSTTPIAETVHALAELVDEGKVREIGGSNFSAEQLDEAAAAGPTGFTTAQNHYSLLTRDPETNGVLDACSRHGIGLVPFFPLESGVLSGKYKAGEDAPEDSRLAAWGDRAAFFLDDARFATVAANAAAGEWAMSAAGREELEDCHRPTVGASRSTGAAPQPCARRRARHPGRRRRSSARARRAACSSSGGAT